MIVLDEAEGKYLYQAGWFWCVCCCYFCTEIVQERKNLTCRGQKKWPWRSLFSRQISTRVCPRESHEIKMKCIWRIYLKVSSCLCGKLYGFFGAHPLLQHAFHTIALRNCLQVEMYSFIQFIQLSIPQQLCTGMRMEA